MWSMSFALLLIACVIAMVTAAPGPLFENVLGGRNPVDGLWNSAQGVFGGLGGGLGLGK
uniref:Glycine-rich peptide n=1 Tax=Scytodes thoracica TaxID=1112478 RepID=A0A0A0V6D7_SCYTH|nr:glycine-rich peptide [Scytodes thoracica]